MSPCSAAIRFGAVTVIAGISGTVFGSELSKFLSRYTRKAEALVCSLGLLVGAPFLFFSLTVVQYKQIYVAWVRTGWSMRPNSPYVHSHIISAVTSNVDCRRHLIHILD